MDLIKYVIFVNDVYVWPFLSLTIIYITPIQFFVTLGFEFLSFFIGGICYNSFVTYIVWPLLLVAFSVPCIRALGSFWFQSNEFVVIASLLLLLPQHAKWGNLVFKFYLGHYRIDVSHIGLLLEPGKLYLVLESVIVLESECNMLMDSYCSISYVGRRHHSGLLFNSYLTCVYTWNFFASFSNLLYLTILDDLFTALF